MIGATGKLFEPDVILPMQFFATRPRLAPHKRGEVRLLIAVLADAVDCFQKNAFATDTRNRRLFKEAEEWLMGESKPSEEDGGGLSFEYACEILSLDPEYLRQGLQRWRRNAAGGDQPDRVL